MVDNESEIDDENFFLSPTGKTDPKSELEATITALLGETHFDDNATACRFPARKAWLEERLEMKDLPSVTCKKYDLIVERLAPQSVTLVFPAAHINSPASMFGHTFLRINSKYKSSLLAYAINYSALASAKTENPTIFAIKGLTGGYYGEYSLLPYYEKLKEYRDAEQRDVWEYDLDFDQNETMRMVRHIWELNKTKSHYYFFTENCSYNMLWLMELARPSVHLREQFWYEVIPLESVHAAQEEKIISAKSFRPSKRSKMLAYEKQIKPKNMPFVKELAEGDVNATLEDMSLEQKRFVYEAAIEYLEVSYSKNSMQKEEYLSRFHTLTKSRAALGMGTTLDIKTPPNPLLGHRSLRTTFGAGMRDEQSRGYLGIRPAYHDIKESSIGFMRGTQIEFLNLLLSYGESANEQSKSVELENATLLSIASFTQRSEFYSSLSWRVNLGWNRESLGDDVGFGATLGAGYSLGSSFGYLYAMVDPFVYEDASFDGGVGASIGGVVDAFSWCNTHFELTQRHYVSDKKQSLAEVTQGFSITKDAQLQLKYLYKERDIERLIPNEQSFLVFTQLYF